MHRKTIEKNKAKRMKRQDYTFSKFAHERTGIKVPVKRIMYSFKGGHVFVFNYLDIKRDRNQFKAFCITNKSLGMEIRRPINELEDRAQIGTDFKKGWVCT